MTSAGNRGQSGEQTPKRVAKLVVSIVVVAPLSVVVGYGGGLVLTVAATVGMYGPDTADGEGLRERLLSWPERNRRFMRTNGRGELPLRP